MDQRPTSPHLTIYRKQITSVLSITHRLTGVALAVGSALLVAWLYVAAYDPSNYSILYGYMTSDWGRVLMLGWTLAFYYHLSNGIRHLFWDIGKGFTIPQATRSGWLVVILTVVMTGVTWCPYFKNLINY